MQDSLDAVDALDEPDEAAKADRERRLILNAEVPSMMTGMVASVVEEHRLAAMFLNATDQHRAVFTADFGIHVDDAVDARNLSCDFLDNGNSFFVASVGHGLAHAGEFVVDAVSCGKPLDRHLNVGCHVVVDFRRFAAHFELHEGVFGNDVSTCAGFEPTDLHAGDALAVPGQ